MNIELSYDDYFPHPPADKHFGIGVVGSGGIVRGAHLPAYKKCGYRVLSCSDVVADAARAAAEAFDIPHWTTDLDELLANPEIEIIDLAVHARHRPEVIEQICNAPRKPRGILSQKPFALSIEAAETMVAQCRAAGITLMVNQQGRFAPSSRGLKHILDQGHVGHLFSAVHFLRAFQDQPGSWYVAMPDFNIVDHGIHWIDLSRYFTGRTPEVVKATAVKIPGQVAVSPMIYSATFEYAPEAALMSTLHFNNIVQTVRSTGRHLWCLDGTEGSAILEDEVLTVVSKSDPLHRHVFRFEGAWWNDAFGGTMGELMRALSENREPMCSGADNLNSIRTALAMVKSSETGEAVRM